MCVLTERQALNSKIEAGPETQGPTDGAGCRRQVCGGIEQALGDLSLPACPLVSGQTEINSYAGNLCILVSNCIVADIPYRGDYSI